MREQIEGDHPLFAMLKQLRIKLEQHNILLMIAGCRYDVWPSGMQLSMNLGTAYILEIGKTGGTVIGIFEDVTDQSLISTLEKQEKYHKDWIQSIR